MRLYKRAMITLMVLLMVKKLRITFYKNLKASEMDENYLQSNY